MKTREELWEIGRQLVLSAPQLYVDVDVEADGIAGYGSMLSIGGQSPTGESFYAELRPISSNFRPRQRDFCEMHGLQRERLLREGHWFDAVMRQLHRWLHDLEDKYAKPLIFTAFNAAFDWAFVDLYYCLAGIFDNPFGIAPFDLKSLALPLAGTWDWSKTAKSNLPQIIIPDGDFTHNALEDAQYQQKLHFGLAGILGPWNYLRLIAGQ